MKALSLWQPWASLWCSRRKIHETRHWPLRHRGWLAVHAAKKLVSDCGEDLDDIVCAEFGPHWRSELPCGALIGVVNIINCLPTEKVADIYSAEGFEFSSDADDPSNTDWTCENFEPGRFAFQRREFRLFKTLIPYRGQQGLFSVPDELLQEALEA